MLRGDSAFVPRGLATVSVPAGSVVSVDVTSALATKPAAALITADHPVVAGAALFTGAGVSGIAEQAFSSATPALAGPAAAVVNFVRGRSTALILTAPVRAADVRLVMVAGFGPGAGHPTTVHVPGGRTVQVDVGPLARGWLLVAVTLTPLPGGGPVYAAREESEAGSHGPMFTVMPMRSAPQLTLVRPAAADLSAGLSR